MLRLGDDPLLRGEPVAVVEVELARSGSAWAGVRPRVARNASMVATPCTSRCQSLAERSSMPAGICCCQNDIGRPTTTYGSPWWPASAASASPNGPAPTIKRSVLRMALPSAQPILPVDHATLGILVLRWSGRLVANQHLHPGRVAL